MTPLHLDVCKHANPRFVLVQCRAKLLSRLRQLLLQCIGLEGNGIPFILKGGEEGRYGGQSWRSRSDCSRSLELDEIVCCQLLAADRIRAILGYVGLYELLLKDVACESVSRVACAEDGL